MPTIKFEVIGKPQPAGSKKAFVIPGTNRASVTDANEKSKPWQAEVKAAAMEAYDYTQGLITGPIAVEFMFVFTRPKSHFGTGRNADRLKDSAPAVWHTVKPDALKLARGVEDALTGVIYKDDAQIVHETLIKRYGQINKCVVEIVTLE